MIRSEEEVLLTQPSQLDEEYTKRGVTRYIMVLETIPIRDRLIIASGEKFLPAGELIEIRDIPVPYYDTDTLEDERENADIAIANKNSPTGGAKFKHKTSFAIVDEVIQNYQPRGVVYFKDLNTTTQEGRKLAAQMELRLKLADLVNPEKCPTLMDAITMLEKINVNLLGLPKAKECRDAIVEGLNQAILHRQAWAQAREAEIQLGLKGKPGRVATYQTERDYAASVGIVLTDANVMKSASAAAGAGASVGESASDAIAAKLLLDQNEALAEQNDSLTARLAAMEEKFNKLVDSLGGSEDAKKKK